MRENEAAAQRAQDALARLRANIVAEKRTRIAEELAAHDHLRRNDLGPNHRLTEACRERDDLLACRPALVDELVEAAEAVAVVSDATEMESTAADVLAIELRRLSPAVALARFGLDFEVLVKRLARSCARRPDAVMSEGGLPAGPETERPNSESASDLPGSWIPATLCINKVPGAKDVTAVRRYCEKHDIPTRKPSKQRLEVHLESLKSIVKHIEKAAERQFDEVAERLDSVKRQQRTDADRFPVE